MNVAFIEHTEDDVDDDNGSQHQIRFALERGAKSAALPEKRRQYRLRQADFLFGLLNRVDGFTQRTARDSRLNDSVTAGNWSFVGYYQWRGHVVRQVGERAQGHHLAGGRFDINLVQRFRGE